MTDHLLPDDPIDGPTDEQLADPAGFDLEPINDDRWAEWAMRRLRHAQHRIIDATLQYDAWLAPLTDWYERVTGPDMRIVERLTASLESYAIAERARDEDRKTIILPSGDIATRRASEPTVDIVDEKAVLVWAEGSLDGATYEIVVPPHPKPLVSELRKLVRIVDANDDDDTTYRVVVDANGEIVPGVAIVDPETNATVKPRGD